MKITVRYFAQAREAVGRPWEELELEGPTTLGELLARLARQHGAAFARMALDGSGSPHPSLFVVIGDQQVRPTEPCSLRGGETITLMSPISGG